MSVKKRNEALRAQVQCQPNGYYAISICPQCKGYLSNPDGDTRTASIELCDACLRKMPRGISRKYVRWILATAVILTTVLCWLFYSLGAAPHR